MQKLQLDLELEDEPVYKRSSSLPAIAKNENPPLIQKSNNLANNISEENKSAASFKDSESVSMPRESSRSSL